MHSFLLPGVLIAWVALCTWVAWQATAPLPDPRVRLSLSTLAFLCLLPLPLIDELLAQPAFDALCRERALLEIRPEAEAGRSAWLVGQPAQAIVGLPVAVTLREWRYMDAQSHETVATFARLRAGGGKLATALGDTHAVAPPLTFEGSCGPLDPDGALRQRGVRLLAPAPPMSS